MTPLVDPGNLLKLIVRPPDFFSIPHYMNLMGRAKIIWSHCRDMRVEVSTGLIKYIIPVHIEQLSKELGEFVKAEKQEGQVVVYYRRMQPPVVDPVSREHEKPMCDPFKVMF